jgi:hypothetical protein
MDIYFALFLPTVDQWSPLMFLPRYVFSSSTFSVQRLMSTCLMRKVIWTSSTAANLFSRLFLATFCVVVALALDVLLQAATANTRHAEKRVCRDYRSVDADDGGGFLAACAVL